jgi:BarA-like signal transduction histidine kinase
LIFCTLAMEFELVEAVPSDVDVMADVLQLGKAKDSLWKPMMRNITYENLHTALVGHFRPQFDQAGSKTFKISEFATEYVPQMNHGN